MKYSMTEVIGSISDIRDDVDVHEFKGVYKGTLLTATCTNGHVFTMKYKDLLANKNVQHVTE